MRKIVLSLLVISICLNAKEIYATFSVEAQKSANLAFSSSGIVDEVTVDVGSVVKRDEILAKLKNSDIKAKVDIAQIALKYAKLDYNRQLRVKNIIDKSKFDSYAFRYENAKAEVALQKSLLDKTILTAPFDGIIYEKSVEVGDVVSGAMLRTILKIESLHKRKLILEFDQKYWSDVKVGDSFIYHIDGSQKEYKGIISKIYPSVESSNRKIKAEVESEDIMVGLFGNGTIITSEGK